MLTVERRPLPDRERRSLRSLSRGEVYAVLAEIREAHALERGLLSRHRGEDSVRRMRTIDAVECVAEARDCLDARDCISGRRECGVDSLHAALEVREAAVDFGIRRDRPDLVSHLAGLVRVCR